MAKVAALALALLAASAARGEDWEALADAEAAKNRPAKAAELVARAVALRPGDSVLLKKHAELAAWAGDSAAAERSYRALVRLDPSDYDSLYQVANTVSWQGRTREAIGLVEDCVARRPGDAKALLFLSQLRQWDGDAEGSTEALELYKKVAGPDAAYSAAQAGRLVYSGRERAAAAETEAALKKYPHECGLYLVQAEAQGMLRRWGAMSDSLARARANCPDKTEVDQMSGRLGAPLRHAARGSFSYAKDSTGVETGAYGLDARARLHPAAYLSAGLENGWLRGKEESGLETQRGDLRVDLRGAWIGAEGQAGDALWLEGRVGHRASSHRTQATLARFGAELRPADGVWLRNDFSSDLYAVSPRAVSLGVRLIEDVLHASWRFSSRGTLYADAGYGSVSDGNHYWTGLVAPRWTVVGGAALNLDAGVSAKATGFSDPAASAGRGYYAPGIFRQFMASALASWVLGPSDVISASFNIGKNKDENQPRYGLSYDYSIEGAFGLYRDWLINPRLDVLEGLSTTGGAAANYIRRQYSLNLTRRF